MGGSDLAFKQVERRCGRNSLAAIAQGLVDGVLRKFAQMAGGE